MWGFRFLSHCLHLPPTHFAYTARTSICAFPDWQMERVVFDISWDGLAYAKSPRVRLTWFKKLLCISSPSFGWVAFEIVFFFSSLQPCPHSMNLFYSSSSASSHQTSLKTWISLSISSFSQHPAVKKRNLSSVNKYRWRATLEVSRAFICLSSAVWRLCDLAPWHGSQIAACFFPQDQVYRAGRC